LKKVVYVSPESFIDVDIPLIKELNKLYDLLWIVTFVREIEGKTRFFSSDYISEYCKKNNVDHIIVEEKRRSRNPLRIISAWNKIIRPIKIFKPDVIYFESFYDPYLPFVVRLFLRTEKTIVGIHDVKQHSSIGLVHKIIHSFTIKIFKFFHVFSYTQKSLFTRQYPEKKVKVARLFLKDYGGSVKTEKNPETTVFLFFGRNYNYKGLDILFKAISAIPCDLNRKFKVIIAGKCENFETYTGLIRDTSVYDFRLRFINNEEVPFIFAEADYLVLPYRDVTQCGPLFISFNYNLPSVTSDLPGFIEYIKNGSNGFTFGVNDVNDLAKCLTSLIQMDFESRMRIRDNLAEYVKSEFNIGETINEYKQVFDQVF
jgi:glycosyltransferase involved in cell wall biosynthesis